MTTDGNAPDVSAIDSETLDSLEIGYRAVYPGLSYEATAFIMQKENYHFRDATIIMRPMAKPTIWALN